MCRRRKRSTVSPGPRSSRIGIEHRRRCQAACRCRRSPWRRTSRSPYRRCSRPGRRIPSSSRRADTRCSRSRRRADREGHGDLAGGDIVKGTIIRRGSAYSVVIELDRDPVSGKRRREWHSGFRTKRDAEEARVRILAEIQRGDHVTPSELTFGTYLNETWLPAAAASIRASTLARYKLDAGTLVREVGGVPLQRLTGAHLDALYAK